jgi:hypothetical protein
MKKAILILSIILTSTAFAKEVDIVNNSQYDQNVIPVEQIAKGMALKEPIEMRDNKDGVELKGSDGKVCIISIKNGKMAGINCHS